MSRAGTAGWCPNLKTLLKSRPGRMASGLLLLVAIYVIVLATLPKFHLVKLVSNLRSRAIVRPVWNIENVNICHLANKPDDEFARFKLANVFFRQVPGGTPENSGFQFMGLTWQHKRNGWPHPRFDDFIVFWLHTPWEYGYPNTIRHLLGWCLSQIPKRYCHDQRLIRFQSPTLYLIETNPRSLVSLEGALHRPQLGSINESDDASAKATSWVIDNSDLAWLAKACRLASGLL